LHQEVKTADNTSMLVEALYASLTKKRAILMSITFKQTHRSDVIKRKIN